MQTPSSSKARLETVPVTLEQANQYVADFHRHHKPVLNHRWSIGATVYGALVGVVIVGRPVARMTEQYLIAEVARCCTDGYRNACSFLYSAAARVATIMGYHEIQTFILASEDGTSLLAAGWTEDTERKSAGGSWNRPSRRGRREDQPQEPKRRFYKILKA